MTTVGIDQSYTGFGLSIAGTAIKKAFPPDKFRSNNYRLFAVEDWLYQELLSAPEINLVAMEGYASGAKFGREMAGELGWAVKRAVITTLGLEPLVVPPTSLKKFVTGKGNAAKNQMLMGVYKQWGREFTDDNVADAYALEQFGKAYLYLENGLDPEKFPLHKYQVEAVEAVKKLA